MPPRPLAQVLKEMKLVDEAQLQEAARIQREKGGWIGGILIDLGYVSREEIPLVLAACRGLDVVDLDELPPEA